MKKKCKYGNKFKVQSSKFKVVFGFVLALLFSCSEHPTSNIQHPTSEIYYCPMHLDIQQDHPGKCPKCGMDLILKISDALLENVLKPVNTSVLASVKTIKPVFKKMTMDVDADGYLDYDDRAKNNISSLLNGRIEKLYIRYNYQPVHKGEKLFEIYSPELITAQENLIYLLNNDAEEKTLIEASKQKLKLLGFADNLMNELVKTKKTMRTVPVYSNYNGYVQEMTGMGSLKEGQYVMMGETVFNIVNPENIVAVLRIKSQDIAQIYKGQQVEITIEEGMTMNEKIDFIEPILKKGATTMAARVYINNAAHNYKIGSLLKAKIKEQEFERLWIPLSALTDLGKEKMVWLKKNDSFIAKKVETGLRSGSMIEIADGLTEQSEIAVEAHYLTDSESFIKTNEDEK